MKYRTIFRNIERYFIHLKMKTIREIASEPQDQLDVILSESGYPIPRTHTQKIRGISTVLSDRGYLDKKDSQLLHVDSLWSQMESATSPIIGLDEWMIANNQLRTIIYVPSRLAWYVEKDIEEYHSNGIVVRISDAPIPQPQYIEVYYLTDGLSRAEDAIEKYGKFAMIIATVDGHRPKYNMTPSFVTIQSESPEWLKYFLLKPYDPAVRHLTYAKSGALSYDMDELYAVHRGWRLIYNPTTFVDHLIYAPSQYNKRNKTLYTLRTGIKDIFDNAQVRYIINKDQLYDVFMSADPNQKLVLPSKNLEIGDTLESLGMGPVVIARPLGYEASHGKGVEVITSNSQLEKLHDIIKNSTVWTHYTVSEYITNPLLVTGKKMHIRFPIMVTSWGHIIASKFSNIVTAKLSYQNSDYTNPDIHDTHFASTVDALIYPVSLSSSYPVAKMQEGLDEIIRLLKIVLRGAIRSYPESPYAYQIYGADVMFREDGSAVLLEINARPGFGTIYTESTKDIYYAFHKYFHQWIYENGPRMYHQTMVRINLKLIENATDTELFQLSGYTTDKQIMVHIGKGDLWDINKLIEMRRNSRKSTDIRYKDWIVISDKRVVGYVSLRPIDVKIKGVQPNSLQIRILVGVQQMGYGQKILDEVRRIHTGPIWSIVKKSNKPSISLFQRAGWVKKSDVNAYGGQPHITFLSN